MIAEIAAGQPQNPFLAPEYVEARRQLGHHPVAFGQAGRLSTACIGFVAFGRIYRTCEIPSTPPTSEDGAFWQGILGFCRRRRIASLRINSYASPRTDIPRLPGETERHERFEYLYDLRTTPKYSSNHRRNINRARRSGLQMRMACDEQSCNEHLRLIACSMQRRRRRGESITTGISAEEVLAFVRVGAGRIFRAEKDRQPFSSILVLLASKGAYYHSAGTASEGMRMSAAHFLLDETAQCLKAQGLDLFNLGGAGPSNPGLERFKSEFGAWRNRLECATILPDAPSLKVLRGAAALFQGLKNFRLSRPACSKRSKY